MRYRTRGSPTITHRVRSAGSFRPFQVEVHEVHELATSVSSSHHHVSPAVFLGNITSDSLLSGNRVVMAGERTPLVARSLVVGSQSLWRAGAAFGMLLMLYLFKYVLAHKHQNLSFMGGRVRCSRCWNDRRRIRSPWIKDTCRCCEASCLGDCSTLCRMLLFIQEQSLV